MSHAMPTKFSMPFKHNYGGKLFRKFGDHSFNFSFVHGPFWLRVLESTHRYGVIFTFRKKKIKRSLWGPAWCQRNILIQIHMGHPVETDKSVYCDPWSVGNKSNLPNMVYLNPTKQGYCLLPWFFIIMILYHTIKPKGSGRVNSME